MPKIADARQHITDLFLGMLQKIIDGETPAKWIMPWTGGGPRVPTRSNGEPYQGTNVLVLFWEALAKGYTSNVWYGYSAAKNAAVDYARSQGREIEKRDRKRGKGYYFWDVDNDCKFAGGVRNKEESSIIIYSETRTSVTEDKNGDEVIKQYPFMKYLNVFNADQIDGLPPVEVDEPLDFTPHDEAERLIKSYDVELVFGGGRACYSPIYNRCNVPNREQFNSEAEFYATCFHEFGHSTGHESKLDRKVKNHFGSYEYAVEELVAEFTSAFVCAHVGIEGHVQHMEYLANWVKVCKNDKGVVIRAANAAQKAANLILGIEEKTYAEAA